MEKEIMISVEIYLNNLTGLFFKIYLIAVIILLVSSWVLKNEYKKETFNFLYVFNTLVAWVYLIYLNNFCGKLFTAWYGQNQYESYIFFEKEFFYSYGVNTLIILLSILTGILFFIRKLRINRLYTVFFLILTNFEKIIIILTSIFRDYLPSSWSVYFGETGSKKITTWVICLLVLFFIYWIAHKRKKLPYPSLFLK